MYGKVDEIKGRMVIVLIYSTEYYFVYNDYETKILRLNEK